MADVPGLVQSELGLTEAVTNRVTATGFQTLAGPPQWQAAQGAIDEIRILKSPYPQGTAAEGQPIAQVANTPGEELRDIREQWFEVVHIFNKSIALGFIFTTSNTILNIFNAYRKENRLFQSFFNNAGDGVSITDLPSLPATINFHDELQVTLEVTPDGPPVIDGTLDFTFDEIQDGETALLIQVPLTGKRVVLFVFQPEEPMVERLEWLTDILKRRSGTEQRIAIRKNPRQTFEFTLRLDEEDRQAFEATIFDLQDTAFGIPVWFEGTRVTSAISVSDTTINVQETDFRDFRVGDLAVIVTDRTNFESLTIDSLTSTTITFSSAFANAFPIATTVYPVRTGFVGGRLQGSKFLTNAQDTKILFRILDNDANLADSSAFGTFNSRVFLDEANMTSGTLSDSHVRDIIIVDNQIGEFLQNSSETRSVRGSSKTFFSNTHQRLFEVRELLHFLRGRQVSFYLPTFFKELTVDANITSGSDKLVVKNIGYTDFIQSREPRAAIQVVLEDGTKNARLVLSSVELSATQEELTVDTTWTITAVPGDVDRVEYLERVRMDSDVVVINHFQGTGQATIKMPVKSVFS